MTGIGPELEAHLKTGLTTLCHAWLITRKDGVRLAFTDHDLALQFDGMTFQAESGLGAKALAQSTGLAVDNTEAIGALTHTAIREDEIEQGRFDGAEVQAWLVNWRDVNQRWLKFRGSIGELTRTNGAFKAELRGLTETLNRPLGRVYQKPCTAVLGDQKCRFDTGQLGYSTELAVEETQEGRVFIWEEIPGFDPAFFMRGRLDVLDGPARGLWSLVKHDRFQDGKRILELWEPIRGSVLAGMRVKLLAGCNKQMQTCKLKFNNLANFQGFPDLPGEDWMMAVPRSTGTNTGGSRR
ncbi:MAG: DUF2163 domain-containing protein [Pseudomonadota bacterium]